MEVSSHALDLHRVEGCWLDVGVFTNLTRDHLDYHPDMDHYWACKQKMFTENLAQGPKAARSVAVINRNDPRGRDFFDTAPKPALAVGQDPDNDVYPTRVANDLSGIRATLSTPGGPITLNSSLVGGYNLENILCAAGAGAALGLGTEIIRRGIEAVSAIPGRLEALANDSGRFVYVDYAHTPDALDNVLRSLVSLASGRLICVFGCGGDRDRGKRPKMGDIAGRHCDLAVITSDNPRSEPPDAIIKQIVPGVARHLPRAYTPATLAGGFSEKGHVIEADRRTAIRLAIGASRPGDIILIAGKGHETYQLIGGRRLDFDDRREAAARCWPKWDPRQSGCNGRLTREHDMTTDPQPMEWTGAEAVEATGGHLICGTPEQRLWRNCHRFAHRRPAGAVRRRPRGGSRRPRLRRFGHRPRRDRTDRRPRSGCRPPPGRLAPPGALLPGGGRHRPGPWAPGGL